MVNTEVFNMSIDDNVENITRKQLNLHVEAKKKEEQLDEQKSSIRSRYTSTILMGLYTNGMVAATSIQLQRVIEGTYDRDSILIYLLGASTLIAGVVSLLHIAALGHMYEKKGRLEAELEHIKADPQYIDLGNL
jgi:hypothetical protein